MHFKLCNLVLTWKNKKNVDLKKKIKYSSWEKEGRDPFSVWDHGPDSWSGTSCPFKWEAKLVNILAVLEWSSRRWFQQGRL